MADLKAYLKIHREECLRCSSLVGFAEESFAECHYSAGNRSCPAQAVQVVLEFDQEGAIEALLSARKDSNWKQLAFIMQTINSLPDFQKQSTLEAVATRESDLLLQGSQSNASTRKNRPSQSVTGRSRP